MLVYQRVHHTTPAATEGEPGFVEAGHILGVPVILITSRDRS